MVTVMRQPVSIHDEQRKSPISSSLPERAGSRECGMLYHDHCKRLHGVSRLPARWSHRQTAGGHQFARVTPRIRTMLRYLIVGLIAIAAAGVMYVGLPAVSHASPLTAGGGTTHIVRRGETLTSIARKYGVSVATITRANKIRDPSRIMVGTRLVIPGVKSTPTPGPTRSTPSSPSPVTEDSRPSLIPTTRPP